MGRAECKDCDSLIDWDNVGCKLCANYYCPYCRNTHDCRETPSADKSELYDELYSLELIPTKRKNPMFDKDDFKIKYEEASKQNYKDALEITKLKEQIFELEARYNRVYTGPDFLAVKVLKENEELKQKLAMHEW